MGNRILNGGEVMRLMTAYNRVQLYERDLATAKAEYLMIVRAYGVPANATAFEVSDAGVLTWEEHDHDHGSADGVPGERVSGGRLPDSEEAPEFETRVPVG